jgi:hypothetical protein
VVAAAAVRGRRDDRVGRTTSCAEALAFYPSLAQDQVASCSCTPGDVLLTELDRSLGR